jgi:hypothetical protein
LGHASHRVEAPAERCGSPELPARVETRDGVRVDGAIAVVAGAALRQDAVVELSGELRGFVPG